MRAKEKSRRSDIAKISSARNARDYNYASIRNTYTYICKSCKFSFLQKNIMHKMTMRFTQNPFADFLPSNLTFLLDDFRSIYRWGLAKVGRLEGRCIYIYILYIYIYIYVYIDLQLCRRLRTWETIHLPCYAVDVHKRSFHSSQLGVAPAATADT